MITMFCQPFTKWLVLRFDVARLDVCGTVCADYGFNGAMPVITPIRSTIKIIYIISLLINKYTIEEPFNSLSYLIINVQVGTILSSISPSVNNFVFVYYITFDSVADRDNYVSSRLYNCLLPHT